MHIAQIISLAVVTPVLTYCDVRFRRLPNVFTYPYALAGLIYSILNNSLTALAISSVVIVIFVPISFFSHAGFGMGDSKLLVGLCLWFGVVGVDVVVVMLWTAFVTAGVFALVANVLRRKMNSVPFGPFLLLGGWVAIFVYP